MIYSVSICLTAFVVLLAILRRNQLSLGLPIAYLFQLLLIHVPGALAHVVAGETDSDSGFTAIGIHLTAVGCVCYVFGTWLARSTGTILSMPRHPLDKERFCLFCLVGGWFVTYALSPLHHFASVGALVEQGGFIWMLGVMLGLRAALERSNWNAALLWLLALLVYPSLMLLLAGFLTWGSMAAIVVLSSITVSVRSYWKVACGIAFSVFFGLSVLVNYLPHRSDIRSQVWGGGSLEARIVSVLNIVNDFEWLNPDNPAHLNAVNNRINQNYFVGLAASRLQRGEIDYLDGATIWDGVLALVPRALWPEKNVSVGSGRIVASMTGLQLPEGTSFGVGNVMEFDINFGIPGVIVGFLLLGWLTGTLDVNAAKAERSGDVKRLVLCFLPAVGLMYPGGSIVDSTSSVAAGLIGAIGWNRVWGHWSKQRRPVQADIPATTCRLT